jgi:hypothetical protein
MEANQACNRDARVDCISNQSVAKRQRSPIDAEDSGGASRLRSALSPFGVSRWLTVAQVDEENGGVYSRSPSWWSPRACGLNVE